MARGTTAVPAPALNLGLRPQLRDMFELMGKAMSGDLLWVVTPATARKSDTTSAWTYDFYVELQTAAGETHTWFSDAIATGVSIGDTGGGTATITSTTLTIVDGVAKITVSGDAATWAAGETFTLTVAQATILGYTVTQATGVVTFSSEDYPSYSPSVSPSVSKSISPSVSPSLSPSISPSVSPSLSPSVSPSKSPSKSPSVSPSESPST
jgi:hypothetical protein